MSVVVLEAMAGAKPMVITSVGENSRVVINEQTGLVVPPARRRRWPMDWPACSMTRICATGSARPPSNDSARWFTVQQMIHNYEHLYAQLIRGAATVTTSENAA